MLPCEIGFKDRNGVHIRLGDFCRTRDSKGRIWVGEIVKVDPKVVVKGLNPQYALETNYQIWINDQDYASELEIL